MLPAAREIYIYNSPSEVRLVIGSGVLTAEPVFTGFELPLDDLFGPIKTEPSGEPQD